MKSKFKISKLFILLGIILLIACNSKTEKTNLEIENSVFTTINYDGDAIEFKDSALYFPGDVITLYLINVGKFKDSKDGYSNIEMDVEIKNPKKEIIYSEKSLVEKEGKIKLTNNIAGNLYANWESVRGLNAGEYSFTIIVHDKNAKTKTETTKYFYLKEQME
ncbi:MAG: hypothetical protein U9R42_09675 [Bacteroidota bacterium]|nr:hypothetical protein [Bacteroidota bacterium]